MVPKNISPSHRAILDYLAVHAHVTSQEIADALYFKTCRFAYLNRYREDPIKARHLWASKALYNMAKQGLVRRIINVPGSGRVASVHTFLYEAVVPE
jgi:hypothetical protein